MSLFFPVISKLLSESLLSLYPVFVKNIDLSLPLQLLSRVSIYVIISFLFCNFGFIKSNLFKPMGILLGITTLAHIYASYRGFQLLESGISYTLFYTYPIFILLMSGQPFHWSILIALLGVYLLSTEQLKTKSLPKHENFEEDDQKETEKENKNKEMFKYEGFLMIFLASLTEALIYFQIRKIKTDNNWNHVFISYFIGMIVMLIYTGLNKKDINFEQLGLQKTFSIALLINAVIGTLGYYFRFYATSRMGPILYAFLSYFGIFMSFIYGLIFNKDPITMKKIMGALLIIVSNFYIVTQSLK